MVTNLLLHDSGARRGMVDVVTVLMIRQEKVLDLVILFDGATKPLEWCHKQSTSPSGFNNGEDLLLFN